MPDAVVYLGALAVAIAAMGWLALAMDSYWQQIHGDGLRRTATAGRLRASGVAGLIVSFALTAWVDGPAMASVVWIMFVALAVVSIAFTCTWRPQWLRWLPCI